MDIKTNCKAPIPPLYLKAIFLTLCVTGILTAAVGNTLICVAVYKKGALRTSPNYLLVSLSLASLMYVPVLISYAISLTMNECDLTVKFLCKWTSHVDIVLFCVVMLHLLVISLDRLLTIKMPMRYPTMITTKRTLISICAVWFVGVLEGVTPDLIQKSQPNEGKGLLLLMHGCIQNNKIPKGKHSPQIVPNFIVFMTLTVFLPSGIMLISHAWIYMISIGHYKRIRTLEEAVLQRRVTEMRAAKTAAVTVLSALTCFAPLIVVTFMSIFEPPAGRRLDHTQFNIKYILFPSLKILYLLAISLNPLIYALKSTPFKAAFKELLQALKRCPCKVPDTRSFKVRNIFRRGHTLKHLEPNKPGKNSNTPCVIQLQYRSLTTNPSELSNANQNEVYT